MHFRILLVLMFACSSSFCVDKVQTVDTLLVELIEFYKERDWEQFHSPKNLVMDLAAETGELVELFRWLTEEQSRHLNEKNLQEVKSEIGDVFKIIVYLSHKLGIDPIEATYETIEKMKQKYPVEVCKGKALKSTEYETQ